MRNRTDQFDKLKRRKDYSCNNYILQFTSKLVIIYVTSQQQINSSFVRGE